MADENQYESQNKKLLQYEALADFDLKENQTELAYRDLNSGFFNLDKERHQGKELNDWKEAHKEKKREIERAWHLNSETDFRELSKKAGSTNKKSRAYYRGYSLEELEVFIKNSDRGGNSDEYNSVATELELYNRVMQKGNRLEGLAILMRLKTSTDAYISTRKSPNSTKGKIRKAIISVISEKASALIEQQKTEYKTKAETLLAEVQSSEATDEKVNEAFRAHYDLIYQVLNGNIELSAKELEKLDSDTETVLKKVLEQKVDETQGNNISTKFFNSLGWSSNDARLVKESDLENDGKEMKKSPLKRRMYHAINPYGDNKDAKEAGKQLAGVKKKNNRIFFGLGRFGKGIYTSAGKKDDMDDDQKAEANSWGYGDKIGAVQLVMTVNEHARMIDYTEFMRNHEKNFDNKFRRVSDLLEQELSSKASFRDFLTMKASFFGYNTLIDRYPGIDGVDYYVTTDRKALSISKDMRIRNDLQNTVYCDTEELKKEA